MVPPPPFAVQPLDPALLHQVARMLHKLKHDLSNSLVAAMGELELLASDVEDHALAERLQDTRGRLLRPFHELRRLTASLPLSESAPMRWQDARQQLDARANADRVSLIWQTEVLQQMTADAPLRPVVIALVTNALDAAEAGVTVAVSWLADADAAEQGLVVSDDGPGCDDLAAATRGQRQRAGGAHLGLGLPVAAAILAARGGRLTLQANVPHGLRASANWPTR